ncbi:MAG TPA: ribosome-associated translation inhibitor RaiA [Abditibacteriaceae bacterium]|jgi:putative sigma-54 modulation protein
MASVNVQTKNCEVEDDLQAHIEEKLEHLERLWPKSDETIVRVVQERGRYAAELTLISGGMVLRGEERSANMRQAIDQAIEKLESQMRRYKKKVIARQRRHDNRDDVAGEVLNVRLPSAGMAADGVSPSAAVQNGNGDHDHDEEASLSVVRVKRFALKPMSTEEAALQMGLLGHNFFVFRDAESNQTSVVYRRSNGGYGLIEPVSD